MTAPAIAGEDVVSGAATSLRQRLLLGAALASTALALALFAANRDVSFPAVWGFRAFASLFAVTFSPVGYLVATRRPANPVGWLLLWAGALCGLQVLSSEYGLYNARGPSRLPGGEFVAWFDGWIWVVIVGLVLGPTLVLFPDGRPLSGRWRAFIKFNAALIAVAAATFAFVPRTLANTGLPNPLALPLDESVSSSAPGLPLLGLTATGIVSAASVVLRYRRARGDERQQIKWLAAAAVVFALTFGTSIADSGAKWSQLSIIGSIILIPIAIGIAILRYRLYDIDTIINRALVYGALTAILAGVFAASTELLKRTFVEVTGGNSDLAVVLAIFLVVAVFEPVRGRVRGVVDRRFRSAQPALAATGAASNTSITRVLGELADLRDRGALTDAEFDSKKRELLSRL